MSSLNPGQIRAARAMLDWSLIDLSEAAQISVGSIMRLEGRRPGKVPEGIQDAARVALETAGINFVTDENHFAGLYLKRR